MWKLLRTFVRIGESGSQSLSCESVTLAQMIAVRRECNDSETSL